jgi:hypothetical protein
MSAIANANNRVELPIGLQEWLSRASAEIEGLTAHAAPRCVGPRRVSDVDNGAENGSAAMPGLSFEQEIRIATSLHDLSAALAGAARLVGPAADALELTDQRSPAR